MIPDVALAIATYHECYAQTVEVPPLGVFLQAGPRGRFRVDVLPAIPGYVPGIIRADGVGDLPVWVANITPASSFGRRAVCSVSEPTSHISTRSTPAS